MYDEVKNKQSAKLLNVYRRVKGYWVVQYKDEQTDK